MNACCRALPLNTAAVVREQQWKGEEHRRRVPVALFNEALTKFDT